MPRRCDSPELRQHARQMREAGHSWSSIATALKVPETTVESWVRRKLMPGDDAPRTQARDAPGSPVTVLLRPPQRLMARLEQEPEDARRLMAADIRRWV